MLSGKYSSSQNTAALLAEYLLSLDGNVLILANGAMGTGKTTFTRMLGAALGITGKITSPTFVGLHEYKGDGLEFLHFDIYQVPVSYYDIKELLISSSRRKILLVEWAEKLDAGVVDKLKDEGLIILNLKLSVEQECHAIEIL